MLVIVWNATFSTTCLRKPNSIQNASEEFLLLQLKCDLLVGGQERANSFRNARNREDAAQRLQRFVHRETFHRRFAVLALNIHGLLVKVNN
jgi:hypothetical protein